METHDLFPAPLLSLFFWGKKCIPTRARFARNLDVFTQRGVKSRLHQQQGNAASCQQRQDKSVGI